MCTCGYLCHSLLGQVNTVPTLPSCFFKIAFNIILNLKLSLFKFIQIFWLIFLYLFLVLHMRTRHLNHHFPLILFQHRVCTKFTGKFLAVALAVVHFPRAMSLMVK